MDTKTTDKKILYTIHDAIEFAINKAKQTSNNLTLIAIASPIRKELHHFTCDLMNLKKKLTDLIANDKHFTFSNEEKCLTTSVVVLMQREIHKICNEFAAINDQITSSSKISYDKLDEAFWTIKETYIDE